MARSPHPATEAPLHELETQAHLVAARIPSLLMEASRVSQTVAHGIHGRRRAGSGETFWQFRHFEQSDSASAIDWRRSASSDHLFIRETEWEAAHTAWIWIDLSTSMRFRSHLSSVTKLERAIVTAFAIGELLLEGGERIGYIGGRARVGRLALRRLAEDVARGLGDEAMQGSLPPRASLSRFSECLLFGDFLEPMSELGPAIERLAAQGIRGHLVQILDPAEETLPYDGRTEFLASEGGASMIAGRAESLRGKYRERLLAHRA
ncbi:MAG: DUF58 domain-containing protein, partial [Pseudomonadota bacterium]|nr:DUF58 domain-containing protein [Pseudomonadota bacterium]